MADDKTKQGVADSSRINVKEDYEVAYWTDALNVTREELEQAVREVGTSAAAVRKYLNK
ncbi:DUF3606 domain-containing protein [Dyadobacter sp. CY312]|uniref:DUF3606 domain-containing protein n=1 Tax=Dyadobacter sp. CY312 TaxID=2907303 RepID=UPI001F20EAD3|nr:DUF3606 domain-containing protein [Dyadobacter sp. CY312]MCE7043157.1 DUF3606 domain-containing protein [Dyadobacter sp. CY312]